MRRMEMGKEKIVAEEGRRIGGADADWWDMERGALPWLQKHEPFCEDKQDILNSLYVALIKTRQYWDLADLRYDAEKETVTASFMGGGKKVINVAMDSGSAMIRDVMRGLR